jgi:aryl-alcohol dehydrogenase-like predicted oxidoreductase
MIDLVQYKVDQGCLECGSKDPDLLQYHHINPDTKLYNISDMVGYSDELVRAELAKCIVLCTHHHIKYHRLLEFNQKVDRDSTALEYEFED